ncbi:MAG: sensor histidine kinase [Gammaproteobacteria bacterium]|nr:sensor histidine kinase [Gammaproteobacteria bacterium]
MKKASSIGHRLWQAFIFQALLISITALAGVYAARYVLGDILIHTALEDEAAHFWSSYERDKTVSLPATYNLTGYLLPDDADRLPAKFANMKPGFRELSDQDSGFLVVYASNKGDKTLVLVFNGQQVGKLVLFFGMLPLSGVLIVIYLSSWLAYRFSSRAVSPIIKLSKEVEELDPGSDDFSTDLKIVLADYENIDHDVSTLSAALSKLSDRIEAFVLRERNFTRDASHELRSPITVIKIATDILLADENLSTNNRRTIERIKHNASDMEELIQALLLLARESDNALSIDTVCVNDVIKEEMERSANLLDDKPVKINFTSEKKLLVTSSDKVLSVLIGNLIRNAYSYTDEGSVDILVTDIGFSIRDSGVGMSAEEMDRMFKPFQRGGSKPRGGYGVGLTIVKMLSDRFHWPIIIDSELHKGTTVKVDFLSKDSSEGRPNRLNF